MPRTFARLGRRLASKTEAKETLNEALFEVRKPQLKPLEVSLTFENFGEMMGKYDLDPDVCKKALAIANLHGWDLYVTVNPAGPFVWKGGIRDDGRY